MKKLLFIRGGFIHPYMWIATIYRRSLTRCACVIFRAKDSLDLSDEVKENESLESRIDNSPTNDIVRIVVFR